MRKTIFRSALLSVALLGTLGLTASAQTPGTTGNDTQQDRKDIRQDTKDIRSDRR